MATFGERFRQLRLEKQMTQEELAKDFNRLFHYQFTKAAISQYENNKRVPEINALQDFAKYFNVSIDYLLGKSDIRNPEEDIVRKIGGFYLGEVVKIPIVGVIRAGEPILAVENIIGYAPINSDEYNDGVYFYLKVEGDSMINARIMPGDYVLVRQQNDVENGEIAVVMVDNENATIKRVFKSNGMLILYPENPKYKPITLTKGDVKIIGKVVEVRFKL